MEVKDAQEFDPKEGARIEQAPLPTKTTLFTRNFIPLQLAKFAVFNLKSLKSFIAEA
ncbi:MAG: hypothetical protein LKJ57_07985 [Ancrocorticia sp.]|jgi:hypothetical protein|nr:hypothetical protein [Ancrocorticia sp.]MCI1896566.1 hypothetical protein [Ancrocorticia sp.]MCI1964094.1 hypothetical protein [Ancrocorticia sp.]MCI2001778.1 hypothetical protein [Ancrocorticia sp.]MCI2013519.1 hypothetical protein [Ancrocorticia sp.]